MIHYHGNRYTLEPVGLNPADPALRCGAGFYEILYYNGSRVCHLDMHLDRLLHSLRAFAVEYETVDFEEVIDQVIERNGLTGRTARVDILYPMGDGPASPVITAAPHDPKPYKAYRLCLCDDRHVSSLGAYRTTSAMFAHLALRRARARGFDDAALFDLDDNLLEAATGALVFKKEGTFVTVDSPHRLESTALDLAARQLDILPVRLPLEDLPSFRHAYILNSIIGMRPVVAIGETAFVPDDDTCQAVMETIIG